MNRPRVLTTVIAAAFFSLIPLSVAAHKLHVFSWAGDKEVYGEVFFSGGRKAKNINVQVRDSDAHTVLLTTRADDKGNFQFSPPQQAVRQKLDLLIRAESGDGHRGEWLLKAGEYLLTDNASTSSTFSSRKNQSEAGGVDIRTVRNIVRQELDKELIPIRKKLAESRRKEVGPRDIIGGIGCIIGLAALLAWFQSNKKRKIPSTEG